jgi:hypothetical protein
MLLIHMPELQRRFYEALLSRLAAGDKDAIRVTGEMMKVIERGGISITNQMLNQNVAAGETAPVKGFDTLVRELAEKRGGTQALPSPASDQVITIRPADTSEPEPEGE